MTRGAKVVAALALCLAMASCGTAGNQVAQFATTSPGRNAMVPRLSGELIVFAAASLRKAFDQIAKDFQTANPGVTVAPITVDGSSTLAVQLTNGATADVFAAADDATMKTVVDAGLASEQIHFVSNSLQIVVATGNPRGITGLGSLAAAGLDLVICDVKVPCGAAARKAFAAAGVSVTPVSEEQNVSAVLTKVFSGDADAGLVYRTDVAGAQAGTVAGVDFPEAAQAVNEYPIVILREAPNPVAASAFRDFVTTGPGQQVLAKFGFARSAG
jgi:molybdate transport system substrate-binding protein